MRDATLFPPLLLLITLHFGVDSDNVALTKKEFATTIQSIDVNAIASRGNVPGKTRNIYTTSSVPVSVSNRTKSSLYPTNGSLSTKHAVTPKPSALFSAFKTLTQIVCVIVLVCGILGNSLVLLIFGCRCVRLKTFEIYMVNLAIADLIGTIVFPSIQLHAILGGSFHYIGKEGCKIIYFLTTLSLTESALTLIVISVDRYIIVTRPFRERLSKLTLSLIIAMTWGISSLLGSTHFVADRIVLITNKQEGPMVCRVMYRTPKEYRDGTIYNLVIFAVQNGIPLIVMAILYGLIIIKIRQTQDEIYNLQCLRNGKTTKLLMVIVVSFFVCVTPSNIFYMIYHFDALRMPSHQIYPVYAFLTMLLMANSCINPVIYTRLHTSFRRTMREILCCCCNCAHSSSTWSGITAVTATLRYSSSQSSGDGRISLRELTEVPREEETEGRLNNIEPECESNSVGIS